MVETDLRATKDGVLILMHDASLDRTSSGAGLVREYTWAQLREVRVDGEAILTLRMALDSVDIPFMLDFEEEAVVAPLIQLLADERLRQRVLVVGGNVGAHRSLGAAFPDLRLGLTIDWPLPSNAFEVAHQVGARYINPPYAALTADWVRRAHRTGLKVSTWTVDEPSDIDWVLTLGVEMLITNDVGCACARREAVT